MIQTKQQMSYVYRLARTSAGNLGKISWKQELTIKKPFDIRNLRWYSRSPRVAADTLIDWSARFDCARIFSQANCVIFTGVWRRPVLAYIALWIKSDLTWFYLNYRPSCAPNVCPGPLTIHMILQQKQFNFQFTLFSKNINRLWCDQGLMWYAC